MKFLYAAFIATWLIHIGYLATIGRRYRRLRDEMRQFRQE
jgi:CcmD family protein